MLPSPKGDTIGSKSELGRKGIELSVSTIDCQPPDSDRPVDARRLDTGTNPLLLGNGKGLFLEFLGGICDLLGDSCGRLDLPRRDADEVLEVVGELALVQEAGVRGDLRLPCAAYGNQRDHYGQALHPNCCHHSTHYTLSV